MINCLELIIAATIPASVIGTLIHRCWTNKGMGVRTIQFLAITTMIPMILILALEHILDGCSVAAIVGALAGYLFSHISEYDKPD